MYPYIQAADVDRLSDADVGVGGVGASGKQYYSRNNKYDSFHLRLLFVTP